MGTLRPDLQTDSKGHHKIAIAMCKHELYYQGIYNRLFWKVIHKGGEPAIKYIKIFNNSKDLEISIGNSCSEYQLMHTFLDNF